MTKMRGKVFVLLLFFSKNFETGKLYTEIVQKRLNEAGITDQEEYKKDFMAIGANNAAYFSSLLGAIVPYKIEMFFDMEYQQ